jgi:hypothetical protein
MGWRDKLPVKLQALITHISAFPSKEVDKLEAPIDATVAQKLDAMYEQKKGACRHRAALFIYKFNQLKANQPDIYGPIQVRAVLRGGAHVNIELSVDNGVTFAVLDLGGYISQMHYLSYRLPALQFSTQHKKNEHQPLFNELLAQIERHHGANTLLCLQHTADIELCFTHIRTASTRPVFFVESKEQLQTSLKRLKINDQRTQCEIVNPPAGLLHDFLMAHQGCEPPPIIVINWESFLPCDIVQFNSVIDTNNRRVDNTPVPAKTTIVGLHSRNEKMLELLGDASFVSRHSQGGIYDLTSSPLPPIAEPVPAVNAPESSALRINLYQSPRWQELLIGRASVNGTQLNWQDGALAELIHNTSICQVELLNPPINDARFTHFIADLKAGLPLVFLNQSHSLNRALNVTLTQHSSPPSQVPIDVTHSDGLAKDSFIINPSTFDQCLHAKEITAEGLLISKKGLIEAHANGTLKLCLSDNLYVSQWFLLLDQAQKFKVTLDLTLTSHVSMLPSHSNYKEHVSPVVTALKCSNQFIISDDIEYSVAQLKLTLLPSVMVIDLSESSFDDLLCKTEYLVTQTGFLFNQRKGALWTALSRGETVILKGHCSPEMLHYLTTAYSPSPYFYMDGQKHPFTGTLIVVAGLSITPPTWLNTVRHHISMTQKQKLLNLPLDESGINKPFIQLAMEQNKARVLAVMEAAEHSLPTPPLSDLSLSACEHFEHNRLHAVTHVLSFSPFAVLEGPPAVGKSDFIKALQRNPAFKMYREDEIEQWATELVPATVKKILFRDEINLRGVDCSQDRDLANNPPSIFVKGVCYPLTEQCKIMYTQNPQHYGGERHEPQLFKDLPDCKVLFEQMTPAFIVHRILKPIYKTTFDEETSEQQAITMINEHLSSMRSIRDLQTKAIFECALSTNPIPPQPVPGTKQVCLGLNDFILTASRYAPYTEVLTLLQARLFKRGLSAQASDGARFNGVNGLVLQGPPGVGKSEFIESILHSEGYSEITADTPESDRDREQAKGYYRLRASVSNEEKLNSMHQAFQRGALLIIDEIDSCPLLEAYLNAYLVGEDIHGKRAHTPGFTILSTANGAALKGRRVLPAPLKSRMLALELSEYSRIDLLAIIEGLFISPGSSNRELKRAMSAYLVDSFLTEQKTTKETPPTFREFYRVAQEYFTSKIALYERLELSKEQHEFMLVYRQHPGLDQLLSRLDSKELKAQNMTLDELRKQLKSSSRLLLFGAKKSEETAEPLSTNRPL